MELERARAFLERAAAPVLARIRKDAEGVEYPPRGLLEKIAENLFLPGLEIGDLLREIRAEESGAPGRPAMEELAAKLGEALEADRRAAEGGDT